MVVLDHKSRPKASGREGKHLGFLERRPIFNHEKTIHETKVYWPNGL